MKCKLLLLIPTLLLTLNPGAPVLAQDTSVPDSVRRLIEQSQASNPYEQMAHMQIQVQYREFLDALAGDARHQAAVEAALVAVLGERAALSARVANGQASTAELAAISDYAYLRERVAPLLTAAELALLDNRRDGPSADQLKQQYAGELARLSSSLTADEQGLVLDTVVRHLQMGSSGASSLEALRAEEQSVDDLVAKQMQSFMQASNELQQRFTGAKLQDVFNFINQLQSALYRNRSMSEVAQ